MAQAAAGKTNWFAIWVSVAVVAVVALVIALVVWMNNAATDPGTPPSGSGVNQETGAVVGDVVTEIRTGDDHPRARVRPHRARSLGGLDGVDRHRGGAGLGRRRNGSG